MLGEFASQSVLARGPWHSRAAAHREGHSGAGGGGTFTAWRETPQAEEAVALVAWSSRHHAGPRSALEILRKALRPGDDASIVPPYTRGFPPSPCMADSLTRPTACGARGGPQAET